jgi:Uncharacterized small protein (DUF2158)
MAEQWKEGDVVQLKSGSPKMIVDRVGALLGRQRVRLLHLVRGKQKTGKQLSTKRTREDHRSGGRIAYEEDSV